MTTTVPATKRLFVLSFGCQMNVYDGELMASAFRRAGYEAAKDPSEADVILVNTCAIREHAEQRVYARLGEPGRHKVRRPGRSKRNTLMERLNYLDGVSIEYPDWRFNLRMSNTEPILRLNVESRRDEKLMKEKTEELLKIIRG